MSPLFFIILASLANALASIFLTINADKLEYRNSINISRYSILAIIFFGLNFLLYSKALERIEVSYAYPLLVVISISIIYVFSIFYYEKEILVSQIFGSLLISFGLYLVLKN